MHSVAGTSTIMSESNKNAITLCHLGPSPHVPTISTFVLKLMAYLRMRGIPYVEEFTFTASSKGKMPYIKDDGKQVADSNFIIAYLNEKLGDDLDKNLTAADKAVSLAFKRLIEENLYWTLVYFNWTVNYAEFSKGLPVTGFRKTFLPIAGPIAVLPKWKKMLHGQGMGRHSKDEVIKIAEDDMTAIATYLGEKAYFMGDTPTEIDCALFGILGCFMYASPSCPHKKLMNEKFMNLVSYTERIKSKYFPDWDELSRDGRSKKGSISKTKVAPKPTQTEHKKEEEGIEVSSDTVKEEDKNDNSNAGETDTQTSGIQ